MVFSFASLPNTVLMYFSSISMGLAALKLVYIVVGLCDNSSFSLKILAVVIEMLLIGNATNGWTKS